MTTEAGIWIDHRKAVIVTLSPEGEHTTLIESNAEKHPEREGDSLLKGPYEARQVPADDSRQRALTGALNIYYGAVITVIRAYSQKGRTSLRAALGHRATARWISRANVRQDPRPLLGRNARSRDRCGHFAKELAVAGADQVGTSPG